MVSVDEAKQVFRTAFSRPPRLLFTNPVCFLFSLYYSYIYGKYQMGSSHKNSDITTGIIYLCLVTIPLLFGGPPFDRPGLFSYEWPKGLISLSYLGLGQYHYHFNTMTDPSGGRLTPSQVWGVSQPRR